MRNNAIWNMRILLVNSRHPWPARRGDQVRALQYAEILSERHAVTLLTPASSGESTREQRCCAAEVVGYRTSTWRRPLSVARSMLVGLPLQSGLFQQATLARELRRRAADFDLVILQLVRLAGHTEDLGRAPLIVDFVDSLALNLERRSRFDRPLLRPLLRMEARRLAACEGRLADLALASSVVCDRDRQAMARRLSPSGAARLRVVPLAVGFEGGSEDDWIGNGDGPPTIVLTGNLGYFVNADALRWWMRDVWPLVRAAVPEARLVVAGDRPGPGLRRAVESAGGHLTVSPASLQQVLAGSTVAIAPLRCGSGVPVKVLEAWSVGVPVVATPWAAAGASARHGEDLLVAETPQDWSRSICGLLDSPERRRDLAEGGRRRLAQNHSREATRRALLDLVALVGA